MNKLPVPSTAEGVFKAWALCRAAQRKGGLSPRSLASYHSLWTGWSDYLLSQKSLSWQEARSPDVRAYLEALNPRAQARGLVHVSTVTQRRYFRVLKKIYDFAVAEGWLESNPVDAGASVSPTEQMDSLVFHAIDWSALLQALAPPPDLTLKPPPELPWLAVRDLAILRLMTQAALTVAELAGLDMGDVQHPALGVAHGVAELWPTPQNGPEGGAAQPAVALELSGARAAQGRRVFLPDEAGAAVLAWLATRRALALPEAADTPLFVSRKKAGRLTPRALFHLANRHISATLGPHYPHTVLAHAGPMTLRNSCIVRWLDAGVPDTEILARAGLREAQALLRLRKHVHAGAELAAQPAS